MKTGYLISEVRASGLGGDLRMGNQDLYISTLRCSARQTGIMQLTYYYTE